MFSLVDKQKKSKNKNMFSLVDTFEVRDVLPGRTDRLPDPRIASNAASSLVTTSPATLPVRICAYPDIHRSAHRKHFPVKERMQPECQSPTQDTSPTQVECAKLFPILLSRPPPKSANTCPSRQGPEKHTDIKEYFRETGFDVLPAVPGRRATSHD